MKTEIRKTYDHYTVFVEDRFYCTADSRKEAMDEIRLLEADTPEEIHEKLKLVG